MRDGRVAARKSCGTEELRDGICLKTLESFVCWMFLAAEGQLGTAKELPRLAAQSSAQQTERR